MIFLNSFLIGGLICGLAQIFLDKTKYPAAYVTALFVVLGAFLDTFSLYDKLIEFAGAGALIPITSFGHSLLHGALEKANEIGYLGIGYGMFELTASGITSAILFAFIFALIFKSKR